MQVNKIEEVDKLFEVEDEFKSTCLCFIFNFLPPYLISHLIVSCLREYKIASAQQQEGLFKDCCVFDVSECGCTKLLLVKYGSMIELQIWQWDKETPCQYEEIFNFIKEHFKLRKHTPSKGRWGGGRIADDVLPSHTCIGDDIERIRLIRNEMQHSGTFALDDARYHILITIIQAMLNRFDHHNNPAGDSYVNRLEEIRKMELKPKDFEDMKAQIQKGIT
ncbi:unnamed protein product [Mytilus edulis]|uniref:DZIP3-like HEPN domain-containing protein n=1 Tax=Mytilus edulis TaxID=6550 RepID=A0A8S3SYV9_MYTED|nr:unnamed protein product [Mytilus edulis]